MPPFGHDLSHSDISKVDGYGDTDAWVWPQHSSTQQAPFSHVFDPSAYNTNFAAHLQPPTSRLPPRHHSIASSHVTSAGSVPPPPSRPQGQASLVKAQPAFKPTWHGFLDTTKDAMTVVEAALQGRLSHISRRPHDKERAEMLTSGTILVYEENASGIKRWTDAVHWSPSRVMNNCLIYRQLVRALKPEEKKTALNPSCGTKRKRKESIGPTITKSGDNLNTSDDEFDNPSFDGAPVGDPESTSKVYANFAQSLTPDQQRRFCGSLIDSYEFKEGGLMKKTISVKYQGTHHHVISYYSLEDVVSGKLKRPFQDTNLADIRPRPELLNGWKVSLEDEESKDMPLVAGYGSALQPSHLQHHIVGAVTQAVGHGLVQSHAPHHLQVSEYWNAPQPQVRQYAGTHHSPQHYTSPQLEASQYSTTQPHQYPAQRTVSQSYAAQHGPSQHYAQPSSPQPYTPSQSSSPQYPVQAAVPQSYPAHSQPTRHYSYEPSQSTSAAHFALPTLTTQYPAVDRAHLSQSPQYVGPQSAGFDVNLSSAHQPASNQQHNQAQQLPLHDAQRRASAPVALQTYSQPHYGAPPHPQSYYVADQKYTSNPHHGY